MRRTTRFTAVCVTLTAVLLTGCGGEDGAAGSSPAASALPSIDAAADTAALATVEQTAEPGTAPVLGFTAPLRVTGPVARVMQPGAGEVIEVNRAVVADVVTVNGSDGTEEGNTYDGSPQILMTDEANMPGALLDVLVGAQVGARLLLASPVAEDETTLWAFEIESVLDVPVQAEGTEARLQPGLPVVDHADSATTDVRMPVIVPADGPPPEELVVQPLLIGAGQPVTADSSLVVQVAGSLWDGTQFQNTWEEGAGKPIVLSGAIEGWRQGLLGQTIGSRVMLVVPPELAWGDDGRGDLIPAGSTLVYVIDILAGI
ncbi:FKBP-type peptidyl-prolyl cis-trans isomerase [Jiangella alkaliphila]|uniref:Peptidyl-prolyl cis-trans isomerase n=1 Tax=Jiangella alkaliphila TaxID=419479 RepID=A0A1H2FZW4_9ACTN|nr:FKBP-type peptidyl-prolyl cis-trans isomerase [Jiangella alkaliphila]SDU12861.1 peptidylprolyl isomerase [Jiangella alkaliphila]